MVQLRPIFSRHALTGAANDVAAQGEAQTASDSAQDAFISLEYRPNPFLNLMKQIKILLEIDPKEALRRLKHVRDDKFFTKAHEKIKIEAALQQAVIAVHHDRKLGAAFAQSVLNVEAVNPETSATVVPGLTAMPLPDFLTPSPIPAF